LLAQHGLGSRREIEKWMQAGRVLLNNRAAQPGDRYQAGDRVAIDGKDVTARLKSADNPQVIVYHKPQGQPVAAPAAQPDAAPTSQTTMERLPALRGARWLVINTMQAGDSGLLLLTTDGRLADALRRRAESIPAAYVARVLVPAPDYDVQSIRPIVQLDAETVEFESIEAAGGEGTNRWFNVAAPRAHRRAAVRALFESRGLKVSRVIQVRFADVELPRDLPRGRHRALQQDQIASLYRTAGLAPPNDELREPKSSRKPARRKRPAARRPTGSRKSGR
jgi:23S rRNA pseudouridine2605 synthase